MNFPFQMVWFCKYEGYQRIDGVCAVKIIEYFSADDKAYWLSKIKESDWGAGQNLYELLKNHKLKQLVGENTKVLMLVDGKDLVSFCTFAEKDDIQPTDLTPWIGWVYAFPHYRGNRCAEGCSDMWKHW